MAAFLAQLFCCCIRDRSSQSTVIDETSRLIPTTSETEFIQPHIVVDHQKMKERLGTIVRSKEGKMVNVNAHLPFDLYSQQHSATSSSRSASATQNNTNPPAHKTKTHTPVRRSHMMNLGRPSTSRSRSSASVSRNNSASRSSSLYYNSIDSVDVDTSTRHPTLNVRLVRGLDTDGSGSQFHRKGRPKSRFGQPVPNEDIDDVSQGTEGDAGDTSLTSSRHTAVVARLGGDGDTTPRSLTGMAEQQNDRKERFGDLEEVLTPTSSQTISVLVNGKRPVRIIPDIEFLDAGDISRSWGS